jgi:D-alanine-D-alanine ligase
VKAISFTFLIFIRERSVKHNLSGAFNILTKKTISRHLFLNFWNLCRVKNYQEQSIQTIMVEKPNIAFITGGYSSESVISYKSAVTIENNLDHEKYQVYKIDITPQGWLYESPNAGKTIIDRNDFSLVADGKKINFDAVFVGIHGTPGEDGRLQGYFDLLHLPYTSCDAATSALTFNKRYTVAVAAFAGIQVARSMHLFKHSPVPGAEILGQLQLPVFVKPNNGGSSIGMSKVNQAEELEAAL